jgi:FMN phosphatase YigB (HAD superfamily)
MATLTVFLDDGGVLNDNRIRSREWQRMVGEFFAPRLGGRPEQWSEANAIVAAAETWNEEPRGETYDEWYRRYQIEWLEVMARHVGVATPEPRETLALAVEAARFVTINCRSGFPDASAAVETLAGGGVRLCTASGEDSRELDGYLTSMGVRRHFDLLFGPDLIGVFKRGPGYYERALDVAGVSPDNALVIDDSPAALAWARAAGTRTILVDRARARPPAYEGAVAADLAAAVDLIRAEGWQ